MMWMPHLILSIAKIYFYETLRKPNFTYFLCLIIKNSKHLYGKALDFFIEGVSGQQLLAWAQADPRTSYAYIIDNGPYVHVDVK